MALHNVWDIKKKYWRELTNLSKLLVYFAIALSPGHDAFLLVAKIAENSSKLSDFEQKGTFQLGDEVSPSSECKGAP